MPAARHAGAAFETPHNANATSSGGASPKPVSGSPEATDTELWRLLFERAYDPTLILNTQGIIVRANAATEDHPACSPVDHLVGRSFLDLVVPEARTGVEQTWEEVVAHKSPRQIKTDLAHVDGQTSHTELSFTPLPGRELFTLTLHDLSEQVALNTELRRRLQEQSALHEIAVATRGVLSLQTTVEQGLRALAALFGLDTAAIHFVDRQGRLIPITTLGTASALWNELRQDPPHLEDTLAGRYALRKRCLIIQDLETFQEPIHPALQASGLRTIADVPLLISGRLIGVLGLGAKRPRALDSSDIPLLESLGAQLAGAIEAARLREQTERRVKYLTTINQLSAALNKALSLDQVLDVVLDKTLALVHHETESPVGAIFLAKPRSASSIEHDTLTHLPSKGIGRGQLHLITARGLFEEASSRRDSHVTTLDGAVFDTSDIIELSHNDPIRPKIWRHIETTLTAIPLFVEKRLIGAILAAGQTTDIDASRLLLSLADMAAVAIEKAHFYQESRQRMAELTTLQQVSQETATAPALDLDTIISHAVHAVQRTLGFEYVGVLLLDENNEHLIPHPSFYGVQEADLKRSIPIGEGISGQVVQSGVPLRVSDVSQEDRFIDMIPGVQSELCVPLKVGERIIGVFDAESSQPDAFSADDERLLATVAGQLAVTIENVRLHQETQRRLREMTILFNFAHHLSGNLQMEQLLETIVTSLREVLGCRGVSIALLDQESQMLEIKAAAGLKPEWREKARLRVGEGIMGQVAATGEPIYVPDVHKRDDFIFFDHVFHSLLTVPLITQNKVIGTLSIDHPLPDAFSADDERLVTIAAAQAAAALENAQLFQAVQDRATNLSNAYEELKEIDRMKDELVQNISHELRTPLTFVRGYVDLLLAGDMGSLNEQQKQGLQIVSKKTSAVTQLVNNIMLLQQLEHDTFQLGLTDLVQIAQSAMAEAQATADVQGVSLHLEASPDLPLVLGDRVRLTLVLEHLLNNAIKFSPNGGETRVRLVEQADRIQVSVSDQGIGIAQDELSRIFDRFYQIDGSSTRRFEGTGLGLAISKKIIQAHGGKIWVKSRQGKGSTFTFSLPKSRGGGAPSHPLDNKNN